MIRLNVGCGDWPAAGWVNIDLHDGDGSRPDRVLDVRDGLPYEDRTVADVYCGHFLEHLDLSAEVPKFLVEVRRVLDQRDGRLCVVGPDLDRINPGTDLYKQAVGGEGRWPGDAHRWDCTEERLFNAVWDAGFSARVVRITSPLLDDWPVVSRAAWQAAILATP